MYVDNDGVVNLARALVTQAREEYDNSIECENYLNARIRASMDSRGIVGYILGWAVNDNEFLLKEVESRISKFLVD